MKQLELSEILFTVFGEDSASARVETVWQDAQDLIAPWEECYRLVQRTEAKQDYGSSVWPPVWITVERETWEDLRDALQEEDGEDYDEEEARLNWECEFPYATEWLHAGFVLDQDILRFSLAPREFALAVNFRDRSFAGTKDLRDDQIRQKFRELTDWATGSMGHALRRLFDDPNAYHQWLERALPNRERFGKLKRSDLWNAAPGEEHFLRDELAAEQKREFSRLAPNVAEDRPLLDLTLSDYLRFCEICYQGAGYDLPDRSRREKYLARADGRHDGLIDLESDSASALAGWFTAPRFGGHPWEIARGGNTTHISLMLRKEGDQYFLALAGSASSRAAETVRMALALSEHDVPFSLYEAQHIKRMVNGEDWIGVLPHYFGAAPRYCHGFFPDDDDIHDFMSYITMAERPELEKFVHWYPLERAKLLC